METRWLSRLIAWKHECRPRNVTASNGRVYCRALGLGVHGQRGVERADEIISEATTTTVPANYFDELLVALDEPQPAPRLAKAAHRARRQRWIKAKEVRG